MSTVIVLLAAVVALCHGCDIDHAKSLAPQPLMGGWRQAANYSDADIMALMQHAASAEGAANQGVLKGLHVSEAYTQVVSGTKYCIRFSAVGSCSGAGCQSFIECVAGGFKPLGGGATVTSDSVQCERPCNIAEVRENSKKGLMGGWRSASADDVDQLHERVSKIAGVRKGSPNEVYTQVVQGTKYCMSFQSGGLEDCKDESCPPMTCVASGYRPLPVDGQQTSLQRLGVHCQPATLLKGTYGEVSDINADNAGSSSRKMFLVSVLTVLFVGLVVA